MLDQLGRRWLAHCHGVGEASQHDFFRCEGCRGLVTWHRIRSGGCPCMSSRIRPAVLTLGEKARLLLLPWTITPAAVAAQGRAEAIRALLFWLRRHEAEARHARS